MNTDKIFNFREFFKNFNRILIAQRFESFGRSVTESFQPCRKLALGGVHGVHRHGHDSANPPKGLDPRALVRTNT